MLFGDEEGIYVAQASLWLLEGARAPTPVVVEAVTREAAVEDDGADVLVGNARGLAEARGERRGDALGGGLDVRNFRGEEAKLQQRAEEAKRDGRLSRVTLVARDEDAQEGAGNDLYVYY